MKDLYLLDVSGYIFRSYFALPPMSNADGAATHALYGFARSLLRLLKEFSPNHIAAVFDGPDNKQSRTEIYADYKAHRKPIPEDLPQQIIWAKELCELLGIPTVEVPGYEADDAMGTLATYGAKEGADVFLCTADKDFCQLVTDKVRILNTFKENLIIDPKKVEEIYGVRPDQMIDYLAIMGDASDNIPGLPGFGPKTASALLQEFGTLDEILANPDKIPGKKKQETVREQGELARVSRELATIHIALDFPVDPESLLKKEQDSEGLRTFYQTMNFSSLLKELATPAANHSDAPVDYRVIDSEEGLNSLIKELETAKEISFDTETTSVRPFDAELVGIGLCVEEGKAAYVPANGELGCDKVIARLKPLFENPSVGFYSHNVKYDLHILANYGVTVRNVAFDTMLASYLLRSHSHRHSLDHLALHYFQKAKTPIKDLIGSGKKEISMREVPIEKVGEYCCEDVDYTLRIKKLLAPEIKSRELTRLFQEIELPLLSVLLKMERAGIYLDVEELSEMSTFLVTSISKLEEEIHALAEEPFKINSPKQLSEILFEKIGLKPLKKTTTGYSTAADVLEQLAPLHPIIDKVLRYRVLEKLRSTYVDTLPQMVSPKDNRIHCTFNPFVAATGRLASQDPNLQNIPVRTEEGRKIRSAFKPQSKGWKFLSADYSQIELRLMAHLSGDPELIKAFKQGEDVHAYTASIVFGVPIQSVTKEQRHQAKAVNFGILYGQQAFGLSRELRISIKEAATFIETYFDRYPRVREFLLASVAAAKRSGKVTTMIGREREIPDIRSNNAMQRTAAERLAINTPLQGSSADLIKLAMLKIDKELQDENYRSKMLLQIHDELIFEVPDDEIAPVTKIVKEKMEGVIALAVPLIVDVHIGNNWGEC